jgi:hypothetical protein
MAKRKLKTKTETAAKRARVSTTLAPMSVATKEASAAMAMDKDPPYSRLTRAMSSMKDPQHGESVIYWMRMADLRREHVHIDIDLTCV